MLLVVALDPADVQAAGGRSVDIGRKEVVVARANLQLNDYDEEMSWGMPMWLVIGC
jgi:hypothetical protein